MLERKDCNCPCHTNSSIIHSYPCCKDMVLSETAKDAIKDGLAQCNKTIKQLQEDRKVTPEMMNKPFDI